MAGKKMMLAELKVSPRQEFNKKSKDWVKSNSDLTKLFAKDIEYSQSLELDDGKWSEKKLAKALEGLVLYELKYLASAVGNAQKDAEKSPDKLKKIVDKDMPAALADAVKLIRKKCKNALEELASSSGAGADKKVIKEGLDVVREVSSVSLKGVFSAPAAGVLAAFDALHKELVKAERDDALAKDEEDDKKKRAIDKAAEKRRDNAYARSARSVDQILKKYRGAKKEIYSAIDAVVKLRDRLAKAEAPELVAFSKDVNKKIPALNELQSALHEFDVDIVGAYNDIASQKDDSDNIARKRGHFERAAKGHDSAADKARKQFLDLASHFKLIEKKLK